MPEPLCRHCRRRLIHPFLDLGFSPPSNAYLQEADLNKPELYFPLRVKVCDNCWLVQTEDYTEADELFSADYAYFSSTSQGWLEHARQYCEEITARLKLDRDSFVVELASNDGYLLKNFVAEDIPCLGIEPTEATARESEKRGVPVMREFFTESLGRDLASQGKRASLIIGNNVYAHVPDINDFTLGMKHLLRDDGVITLEFPHLLRLIESVQFDTIYHEHFSYLSLHAVGSIFAHAGLRIFDVQQIPTHGGSIRVFGCHENDQRETNDEVKSLLESEDAAGLRSIETYRGFQAKADEVKNGLIKFLIEKRDENKKVAAYGAAAKGNTILNYAGIKPDLLPLVCDAAPSKQGKYLPGSHVPIKSPEELVNYQPDYVLILPWNIADEVKAQLSQLVESGSQFVVAVPELRVI